MPQLDLGISFLEFVVNAFCFWSLYIFKAKKVLPLLNKTLKLRKYKLKIIIEKMNSFENNFVFIKNNDKIKKEDINLFYNKLFEELKKKKNLINLVFISKYYNLFINNNLNINNNYLKNFIYKNNIIKK